MTCANKVLIVLVAFGAADARAGPATAPLIDTATSQFQQIRAELRQTHSHNDWRANLAAAKRQLAFVNRAPMARLELARAEYNLGLNRAALRELRQFAAMGQWFDLRALIPNRGTAAIGAAILSLQRLTDANREPVSRGAVVFALSDPGLLAEDIDFDPHGARFYITSVREKRIIGVDRSGKRIDFAEAPDGWPFVALKVDGERGWLWVTEVAMNGLPFSPRSDWGRSALLCYDLKTGRMLERIEGPRPSGLGDMVLSGRDVIVSDGDGGGVYRLRDGTHALERLDRGDFISPQTPVVRSDRKSLLVPDYVRGVGVLDIATGAVRWLSTQDRFALNGIDGMYLSGDRLIAVQNGTSPERVVAFAMNSSWSQILAETIVERATPTLDPTHGVIVGNAFFYIANSGWDALDEKGDPKPNVKPTAPRIMRVGLDALGGLGT
jgi:hypothetical protein